MSARLDQLRAEMDAKFGPPRSGPPPQPTMAMVGVGWSISEAAPADSDYWPRGGVVLHVDPASVIDEESGELLDRYLVVRAGADGLRWTSLRADQVAAVDDGNRPNARTIEGVCQVAVRELAGQLNKRRGSADVERALELFSLGARLMAVLARPGTTPPS